MSTPPTKPAPVLDMRSVAQAGPVIPVIVLHNAEHAIPLAQALLAGGIRVMEITLRTAAALDAIERIARSLPQVLVGAGTVLTPEDVGQIANAGARFAISPGFSPSVAQACQQHRLPWLPGVATAGEAMQARELGYTIQKCFPAHAIGGTALLKAWAGPLSDVQFCPTGGITADNAPSYLALENVACVGGSWLVPPDALAQGDWARITSLAQQASQLKPA